MKKRELALGLAVLGTVSALCLKGMQAVGRRIDARLRREQAQHYRKQTGAKQ